MNVDSDDDLKTAVAESADAGVVKLNVTVISGVAMEIDNVVDDVKTDDNNPMLSTTPTSLDSPPLTSKDARVFQVHYVSP